MASKKITCGDLILLDADSNKIAHITGATLDERWDMPDATTKDSSGAEEFLEGCGNMSFEGSIDGLASWEEDGNVDKLHTALTDRKAVKALFGPTDQTSNAGLIYFDGKAGFSSVSLGAPQGDSCTISADFKYNGKPTKKVISS